jgi:hypothetical protein
LVYYWEIWNGFIEAYPGRATGDQHGCHMSYFTNCMLHLLHSDSKDRSKAVKYFTCDQPMTWHLEKHWLMYASESHEWWSMWYGA